MSGLPCATCLENQVTASARGRCSGACVDHLLDGQIDWGEGKQSLSPYVQNNSQMRPKQGKKGFKGQEPVAIGVGSSGGKAEGEMET